MFEKEAEEIAKRKISNFIPQQWGVSLIRTEPTWETVEGAPHFYLNSLAKMWQDGAEFGYNKAKEDVKHDLMMKLKDEGIVKPLKDSIFSNKKLSSQEQQELCAWIECAMDFGENLDECAKELEEVNKANEWHFVKDGDLPKDDKQYLVLFFYNYKGKKEISCGVRDNLHSNFEIKRCYTEQIIAWKEIVLPELTKESE